MNAELVYRREGVDLVRQAHGVSDARICRDRVAVSDPDPGVHPDRRVAGRRVRVQGAEEGGRVTRFVKRHMFALYVMLVTGSTLVLAIVEAVTR